MLAAAVLAVNGCNRSKAPAVDGAVVPTPTIMVDSTRTEGPPITYEELERGLVGLWRADASVLDDRMARDFHFYPNGTWVTPSHNGVGGKFIVVDSSTLRMIQESSGNDISFGFKLIGDELTLFFKDIPALYHRYRVATPAPTATPTPGA